ncbi:MAG: hypothetical protein OEZ09_05745 [Betaproteobacteria bacterium]|nr:hypothetical protein [Betaproteobacteria bacterium]MDH5577945.1 hypothetical protein [Betaproteobacteria bacterium]
MHRTRLSLYYLASYLWMGGIGLLLAPQLAARLLLSNTDYPAVMLQALGMFMIGLGYIVVQIIRQQIRALYPTTLIVRLFFCACLLFFYFATRNPLFIVLLGIVALGILLTGANYLSERRA